MAAALADRRAWGAMRMSPTDLADISGWTYTTWRTAPRRRAITPRCSALAKGAAALRQRLGNGPSYFDVRIPGLHRMTVVAADGQRVHPVTDGRIPPKHGGNPDVIVEPSGRPPVHDLRPASLDRSGYARK